eukprot:COSAG05_NODE_130_length_17165_cov_154.623638_29_plen_47_part_00
MSEKDAAADKQMTEYAKEHTSQVQQTPAVCAAVSLSVRLYPNALAF